MSSSKVRTLATQIQYTATFAATTYPAGTLTVTTVSPHLLTTGQLVSLYFENTPQILANVSVTVTSSTVFTISITDYNQIGLQGYVHIPYFNLGQPTYTITMPRATGAPSVLQSYITGTGGGSYVVNGSLDGVHLTSLGTITHGTTSGDTQYMYIPDAWPYLVLTSITIATAGNTITAMQSA